MRYTQLESLIPVLTDNGSKNIAGDITDHKWFDEIPFEKENGVIFLAAGVLHYLTYDAVTELVAGMAE